MLNNPIIKRKKPRKKHNKVRSNTRQVKLAKTLLNHTENGGTLGQAVLEAGYSESSSLQPSKLIESKGVQQLVKAGDKYGMDDNWFLKKIKAGMDNNDPAIIIKYATLWSKLKYSEAYKANVSIKDNRTVNIYEGMSNRQLQDYLNE